MGRPNETYNKKELRERKEKKRKEKEKKKLERKDNIRNGNNLDEMIAYVDEFGNITSTPPDSTQRKQVNIEDIEISVPKNRFVEPDPIRKGVVSFFNESKGFGFIKDSTTKEDIFVHVKSLLDPIKENNIVTYEVERGKKGLNAINVKKATN